MSDTDGPVSWMTLEKGTPVLASDGDEVGRIDEVIADRQKDIFSGVTVTSGLLSSPRFAPADIIVNMSATAIRLSITSAQAGELESYEG